MKHFSLLAVLQVACLQAVIIYKPYDARDFGLSTQLQPYIKIHTEELVQKLDALRAQGIPDRAMIMDDPEAVMRFKDRLEKFTNLLRAYHYRPEPRKEFAAKDAEQEKEFEQWLSSAQAQVGQLEQVRKQSLERARLQEEIGPVRDRLRAQLEDIKTKKTVRPYLVKDLKKSLDRLRALEQQYTQEFGRAFDDGGSVLEAQEWLDGREGKVQKTSEAEATNSKQPATQKPHEPWLFKRQ